MGEELTRRQFLKAGSLLGIGTFLGLQSCEDLFKPGPHLLFEQLESSCASDGETAQLQGGKGKLSFSGAVETPNPCHDLQAELVTMRCGPTERCPNTHEVAITSKPQGGSCIECLGSVPYQGEIRGLEAGLYAITITHDGRPIAEAQVQVD